MVGRISVITVPLIGLFYTYLAFGLDEIRLEYGRWCGRLLAMHAGPASW